MALRVGGACHWLGGVSAVPCPGGSNCRPEAKSSSSAAVIILCEVVIRKGEFFVALRGW
ncbi:hypothetical protein CHLRE_12g508642v5 [Chlamydomonas reinhardtii]|uniref:Uncharacterized protein n=1 Tax=Chlamydomonas reinhardtii TaxID=3055 RepID=A0A2K3D2R3_CHLRE|nr:uncharacterized protein CHLRE_12g508642v5 [Chlamydomonas reinhardtii]PNW74815.1 hypothetical protein CHLRE_12g508642v5 [Chlamydomonas reinhardtii]